MYVIGELKDQNVAKDIVKTLDKKGIKSLSFSNDENGIVSIAIEDQSSFDLAQDIFRVKTGGPRTFAPAPEWSKIHRLKARIVTMPVIIVCVGLYILQNYVSLDVYKMLNFSSDRGLVELKNFQLWRVFTPCLLHFGFLHLFFNLMWWKDLSKIIENSFGATFLILFCVIVGIISNTGQFLITGPGFGGLSGVIFGLFGLIWMLGRYHKSFLFKLPKSDTVLLVGWFILCLTGILNFKIANMAHALGLSSGMLFGIAVSYKYVKKKIQLLGFVLLSFFFIYLGQF